MSAEPAASFKRSGNVNLRMPTALHETLAAQAHEQGTSLNTLLVALLAGGIGFTLESKENTR